MYGQDRQEWTHEPGVDLACGLYGKNRLPLPRRVVFVCIYAYIIVRKLTVFTQSVSQ